MFPTPVACVVKIFCIPFNDSYWRCAGTLWGWVVGVGFVHRHRPLQGPVSWVVFRTNSPFERHIFLVGITRDIHVQHNICLCIGCLYRQSA